MNSLISRHGHFVLAALALFVACALGVSTAHADSVESQISIAGNGQVIVRDAKVIAKSGSTFTVTTQWGTTQMAWSVRTTGSTKFVPTLESGDIKKEIKIGDMVSFSGMMDPSARFAVNATSFKDTSLFKEGEIIGGTIHEIDAENKQFTLIGDAGTTTVAATSGTIVTRDGDQARISDLIVGDKVKVSGAMNMLSRTLTAGKVTYSDENRVVVEARSLGWWGTLMSYLRRSDTGISVRDR